jgi:hypothetical protein
MFDRLSKFALALNKLLLVKTVSSNIEPLKFTFKPKAPKKLPPLKGGFP